MQAPRADAPPTDPTPGPTRAGSLLPGTRIGLAVLLCVAGLGTALRLRDVGAAFLFGDEFHSLRIVSGGYAAVLGTFGDRGSGLALPLLQRIAFDLFGAGHWTIRAPAWIPSLLLLGLLFPLGRRLVGEPAAGVATALVAVSPILVFYAHFGRAYSLVALLALLLIHALDRALAAGARDPRGMAVLVVATAALPWAHPTALGLVLPAYAGALAAALLAADTEPALRRRRALRIGAGLVAGGAICLLVHLPAWEGLVHFVSTRTEVLEYYGDFGALDVASLLFGGRAVALVWLAAWLAGGAALARVRGVRALPLLAACLGPALVIAGVRPYGDAYAYARYVMVAVAPCALVVGFGAATLGGRLAGEDAGGPRLAWLLGGGAALLLLAVGPLPLWPDVTHQHANTYLALQPLPAFDRSWPDTPAFYRQLGARSQDAGPRPRLLEIPALTTRARHLHRHHQRVHRAETWLAPLPREFPLLPEGPYASLASPDWLERAAPDYVVLHLDVADEVARYWRWVYEEPPETRGGTQRALMERHARYGGLLPAPPPGMAERISAILGPPVFDDGTILVWAVHDGDARGGD